MNCWTFDFNEYDELIELKVWIEPFVPHNFKVGLAATVRVADLCVLPLRGDLLGRQLMLKIMQVCSWLGLREVQRTRT